MVEVENLFTEMEVFKRGRSSGASLERVLVVGLAMSVLQAVFRWPWPIHSKTVKT